LKINHKKAVLLDSKAAFFLIPLGNTMLRIYIKKAILFE